METNAKVTEINNTQNKNVIDFLYISVNKTQSKKLENVFITPYK